jgi:hypothetical protein
VPTGHGDAEVTAFGNLDNRAVQLNVIFSAHSCPYSSNRRKGDE